jgi:hypothetical protein
VSASPAVADGKVYIGSQDYKVYCLNAFTGVSIWSYITDDPVFSSPAVADGKVYVASFGTVYAFGPSTLLGLPYEVIIVAVVTAVAAIVLAALFVSRRKRNPRKQESNVSEANTQPKDGDGKPSTE